MSETINERQPLNLPQEQYEPIISQSIELGALENEVMLQVFDIHGDHEIKTCYGDICKIVNALRDYSWLLEMVCDEWNLEGIHRATYEFHAEKLREIAGKFQAGIGYDYDKAVEKCKKKRGRKQRDEDVGGEALAMGYLKAQRTALAQKKSSADSTASKASSSKGQDMGRLDVVQVENYDLFDDVISFWVSISGVPQSIQAKARQIDGDKFNPDCFGLCVNYDFEGKEFYVVVDTELSAENPGNVYYIGIEGEKHWFAAELSQMFLEQAFLACTKAVAGEDCAMKPTADMAIQSAAREFYLSFDVGETTD